MKRIAGLAFLTATIGGCGHYGDHPPRSADPPGRAIAGLDGKAFYLFRAGYKCGGPMHASQLMASWVDKIEIVEGRLIRWGSRCGGEGLPLPPEERRTLRVSADGKTLTLAGITYRQSADPIQDAEVQP
ncbi:hypothetical protein [Novosphingobium sp.]|uniref:hypothetical protein n=1 Tax=Novosphingobium sp. TaxID=1874826 RepID=UPI003BA919FE